MIFQSSFPVRQPALTMDSTNQIKAIDAREFVRDLTIKGFRKKEIIKKLEQAGMKDVLDFLEIQNAIESGKVMRGMLPQHQTYTLPRIVGSLAILMGLGAILLVITSKTVTSRGMIRFGLIAVGLGAYLVFKPGESRNDV